MPKILFKILNEEIPKEQNKEVCNITKIVSHLETDQGCKRLNITTVQATTLIKLFSMLVHLHLLFTKDVWLALVAGGAGLQQEAPPRDIPFGRRRLQKSAAACASPRSLALLQLCTILRRAVKGFAVRHCAQHS